MNAQKAFALLRIAFGLLWAFDAWLKWQPGFFNGFTDQVSIMMSGQPAWIADWIRLWASITTPHALVWAILLALAETAIAIGLIFGIFTRATLVVGVILSLLIWTIPEGFGGPYVAGSTDPGAGIIYVFVFVALWLGTCWSAYSLDSVIGRKS